MVEDDSAVSGWEIVSFFFFLRLRFVYVSPVLCFDLKTGDLVNLNTKNARGVVVGWRRCNEKFVLAGLCTNQHHITNK